MKPWTLVFPALLLIMIIALPITTSIPIELNAIDQPGTLTLAKPQLSIIDKDPKTGCFNGVVTVLAVWSQPTANMTYTLSLRSFGIVATAPGLVVGNSTGTSYVRPNNSLQSLTLWPDVQVNVALSFRNLCADVATQQLRLFFFDGIYSFSFDLP